jgi:hypothetical protein
MFGKAMNVPVTIFLVLGKINSVLPDLLPGSIPQRTILSKYFFYYQERLFFLSLVKNIPYKSIMEV